MTNASKPLVAPAHVSAIAPYQAGKPIEELAREFGLDPAGIVKLASNENPLGMPKSARAAMLAAAESLARYPDPNGFDLKSALATRYGVPMNWITLGNGSNDILEIVALALLEPGTSAVYAQHSFAVYRLATQARGAPHRGAGQDYGPGRDVRRHCRRHPRGLHRQPEQSHRHLRAGRAGRCFPGARAGRAWRPRDRGAGRGLQRIPGSGIPLRQHRAARYPNLIVSRTFSKAYGLAGLRVGFAVSQPALTDLLNRVRQPFNVNTLAQAAAIAALADSAYLEEAYATNKAGKAQLCQAFDALKLRYVPSYGNFVLVHVGDAPRINLELLKRGVIVRPVAGDGLPEWLRVSIGLPQENARFIEALSAILAA